MASACHALTRRNRASGCAHQHLRRVALPPKRARFAVACFWCNAHLGAGMRQSDMQLHPAVGAVGSSRSLVLVLSTSPSGGMVMGVGSSGASATPDSRAPFVGRQPMLARLRRMLEQARAGQPRLVLIEGPAGIGKTTLVRFPRSRPTVGVKVIGSLLVKLCALLQVGPALHGCHGRVSVNPVPRRPTRQPGHCAAHGGRLAATGAYLSV
jgi:AAA ATPase domain